MSKTIDEKVVEMRFDNKNFETNIKTTMSTLDKFKEKLNLSGASKGLEDIQKAAKKVDFSNIATGVDTLKMKLSALDVVSATVISNLTTRVMNAGEKLVKSLSVDNISAGWSKYDKLTQSTQTLMNATGKSMEEINKRLEKLMWFSDETSYGFNDMTSALATMASSGGDIDKLLPLIMGVANATAYAGKGASEFSRVMYNLNQSYSGGFLNLMDWKSVQLAGVNSKALMESLIRNGERLGKITKGQVTTANFTTSLAKKWADRDVMEAAFGEFYEMTEKAYQMIQNKEINPETGEAFENATEAYAALSKQYDTVSMKAARAAQEAKSFREAIDATKDAVSSGWMQTFKLIFGDYEKAKKIWSDLAESLWDIFAAPAKLRNKILGTALAKDLTKIKNGVESITKPLKTSLDTLKKIEELANNVIRGDWGNGEDRYQRLTKAGHNYYAIQNKVNEKLNCAFRYSEELAGAQVDAALASDELSDSQEELLETLAKKSDEELKSLGYTEEQIEAIKELSKFSKMTGLSIKELIENIDDVNGRWLLIESFKNVGRSIVKIIDAIKDAIKEVFDIDEERTADRLFGWIAALHKFSLQLRMSDETAEKVKNTFKGLFSIIDIIIKVLKAPVKIAFNIITSVLKIFNLTLLDVTSAIGNLLFKFDKWLDNNNLIAKVIDFLSPLIKRMAENIKTLFNNIKSSKAMSMFSEAIKKCSERIKEWFANIKNNVDVDKLADSISRVASATWEWIKSLKDSKIVQWFITTIGKGSNTIKTWFDNFTKSNGFANFINKLISTKNKIVDWFEGLKKSDKPLKYIFDTIAKGGEKLGNLFKIVTKSELFIKFIEKLSELKDKLSGWIQGLKNTDNIPKYLIDGFINGLNSQVKNIIGTVVTIAQNILSKFREVLGIHSPSTETYQDGENFVQGFINGIKDFIGILYEIVKNVGLKVVEIIKGLDIGSLITIGLATSFGIAMVKIAKAIENFSTPFVGINKLMGSFTSFVNNLSSNITILSTAAKHRINAEAFKAIAEAIKIIALSIIGLAVVAALNPGALWQAVGAVVAIVALLVGSMYALEKINKSGFEKNSLNFGQLAGLFLGMAIAVAVFSRAINRLGKLGDDKLKVGVKGLVSIAITLLGMMFVLSKIKINKSQAKNLSDMMASLSIVFILMSIAVKNLGKLNDTQMTRGIIALSLMGLVLLAMIEATKIVTKAENIEQIGGMLQKIASVFLMMGIVVLVLGKMKRDQIEQGYEALCIFSLLIAALMLCTRLITKGENVEAFGNMMSKVGGAFLMMAVTVKILGKMKKREIRQGYEALVVFTSLIAILMLCTRLLTNGDGASIKAFGVAMLGIGAAFVLMAAAIKIIGGMDSEDIKRGISALAGLSLIVAGLMLVVKKSGGPANILSISASLITISLAIGILAGISIILGYVSTKKLAKGVIAVGILGKIMSEMIKSVKGAEKAKWVLLEIALIVGLLAFVLLRLADMNAVNVATSAGAVSAVLEVISLIMDKLKNQDNESMKRILLGLGLMAIIIAELWVVVGIFDKMGSINNTLQNAGALAIAALTIAGLMVVCEYIGGKTKSIKSLLVGLGAMAIVIAELFLVVGLLAAMQDIKNAQQNALALTTAAVGLSLLVIACAEAGAIIAASHGLALLGVVSLAGMLLSLFILVGVLDKMATIDNAVENLNALTGFMKVMTEMLVSLALVAPLAVIGVAAMYALTGLIAVIAAFATGIGYLAQEYPQLEDFLDKGLPILVKVAAGIGKMIGQFVGNILTGISDALPGIAKNLSEFMIYLTPFLVGCKLIDDSIVKSIKTLAEAMLVLIGADFLTKIFDTDYARIGLELSKFIIAAMPFIMLSKFIKPDIMYGVKALAEAIQILTASNLKDQIVGWLTGTNGIEHFAGSFKALGEGLRAFIDEIGEFSEPQIKTVECASTAIKTIAEAAKAIPNEGGLVGKIMGENNVGTFADSFQKIGQGLNSFIGAIGTFGDQELNKVDYASQAIEKLAGAAEAIPNEGGWVGKICGENNIGTFAGNFKSVAIGLKDFVENIGTFGEEQVKKVDFGAQAIRKLIEASQGLDLTGGWLQKLFGEKDIKGFVEIIPSYGKAITGFVSNLDNLDDTKIATVECATKVLQALGAIEKINLWTYGDKVNLVGKSLITFGDYMKQYINMMKDFTLTDVAESVKKAKEVATTFQELDGVSVDSINKFAESLKSLTETGVNGFINGFTSTTTNQNMLIALGSLFTKVNEVLEASKETVKGKFKEVGEEAVKGLKDKEVTQGAYNAGVYFVQGFANGIKTETNKGTAKKAAFSLGQNTISILQHNSLDEHSPSKVTHKIGEYFVQGFANGIEDNNTIAYIASENVGELAKQALNSVISSISDAMNSDIDMQPTIKPVLDLSNISTGSKLLESMLDNDSSVNMSTNLRAISLGMSNKNQNGNNDDIISAIKDLGDSLSNAGGDVYNVNGVTYDDGSNVSTAVKSLLNAVKVERRR